MRVAARVADLERDFDAVVAASERAQVRALLNQAHAHLAELDAAGQRVADGTYGVCVRCGKPIGVVRVRALPTAEMCVDCSGRG